MTTKSDLLIEVMGYCYRGVCHKCHNCNITDQCLTDGFYGTIPCDCPCNDVCHDMTIISFWLIDEGKY